MAWQKLHLAKVTYLLGKNSLFHSSWKMCAWHLLVCHTEALGDFLLLNHKSAVPRKFLIFVCPGCCNSIFFPIAGFAIVNQLLASWLNCCNMLIFELHLESAQELYLGSYSLPKRRMLLWAAVLQDPLLVLTWTACMGFTYRISFVLSKKRTEHRLELRIMEGHFLWGALSFGICLRLFGGCREGGVNDQDRLWVLSVFPRFQKRWG